MPGAAVKPKSSGVVVPHSLKWHGRWAAASIATTVRLVAATMHYRVTDHSGLLTGKSQGGILFCTWHNRLALSLIVYRKFVLGRQPDRRLAALVSASKDGGLLARILEHFGVQPVRGSSSRRGPQALLELTTWAERGYDLAITPDGPRGPCYRVQEGIIALAQLTGRPIVPVVYSYEPRLRLNSWDRFLIPVPFGRCAITFDRPFSVPKAVSDSEREALRLALETRMKAITRD